MSSKRIVSIAASTIAILIVALLPDSRPASSRSEPEKIVILSSSSLFGDIAPCG